MVFSVAACGAFRATFVDFAAEGVDSAAEGVVGRAALCRWFGDGRFCWNC